MLDFSNFQREMVSRAPTFKKESARKLKISKKYQNLLAALGYQINNNNNGVDRFKKQTTRRREYY